MNVCCKCHERPRLFSNSYCKECERERSRLRYRMDPKVRQRSRHPNNKEWVQKWHKEQIRKWKGQTFSILGNKCNNPNCPIPPEELDISCLQLDHINGGGRQEKLRMGASYLRWKKIYLNIIAGSKEYQLLCPYCNWKKAFGVK